MVTLLAAIGGIAIGFGLAILLVRWAVRDAIGRGLGW